MRRSIGHQRSGYGWEMNPRRAHSLLGFLLAWFAVTAAFASSGAASNRIVGVGDDFDPPQTDGRYIFGTNTKDARKQGFRYRELVRVDTTTGKRTVVVLRKKQLFSDVIAGGGKIAAVISFAPRVKGVLIAASDGSGQRVVSKTRLSRPSNRNNVPCDKSIRPSSISANGDAVVELVQSSCNRTFIKREFLIFRADGRPGHSTRI